MQTKHTINLTHKENQNGDLELDTEKLLRLVEICFSLSRDDKGHKRGLPKITFVCDGVTNGFSQLRSFDRFLKTSGMRSGTKLVVWRNADKGATVEVQTGF